MRPINFGLKQAAEILPKRKKTDNKSSAGRTLVVAGSEGMFGAAVLAATAAARCGSGYTTLLLTDAKKFNSQKNPDFLIADYKKKKLKNLNFSALAMGPGLGQDAKALSLLKQLLQLSPRNVVLDADALNLLAQHRKGRLPPTWIVTPHEGELARLLKTTSKKIKKNREQMAREAQETLGCIVLLKGHTTLVVTGKNLFKIKSGNAALAKAGTGDVLCGMIAGFLAQGLEPEKAALLGAFVHGYMADNWLESGKDKLSLMASDLLVLLPESLFRIRHTNE